MNASRRSLLAAALAAPFARPAFAQGGFPTRPITFVVPYAAGGNVDITARLVASAMQGSIGQPIVVDNRSGASGTLAGSFVARAEPDGYTLFVASNGPLLFAPMIMKNPPYLWDRNFVPVSLTSISTNVLLVRKDLPVRSVAELVEYGRRNKGKLNLGISSGASINHFLAALLKQSTQLEWTEVSYRGNVQAMNDLIGGTVDMGIQQLTEAAEHIKSGAIRAIAVLGPERSAALPGVPTIVEAGYPDVQGTTFSGIMAPAGTPQPVVEQLSAEIRKALATPEVKGKLASVGSEARGSTPAEFGAMLKTETATWARVIRDMNIPLE